MVTVLEWLPGSGIHGTVLLRTISAVGRGGTASGAGLGWVGGGEMMWLAWCLVRTAVCAPRVCQLMGGITAGLGDVVISFRAVSGNCVVDEDSISFGLISLSLHTDKCVMEGLCVRAWGA